MFFTYALIEVCVVKILTVVLLQYGIVLYSVVLCSCVIYVRGRYLIMLLLNCVPFWLACLMGRELA